MRISSLLLLFCLIFYKVFSEEPNQPAIDISPVVSHLSMLKRMDNISLKYRSSFWKKAPIDNEDWRISTISTLAIFGSKFRIDSKIDREHTTIAKNTDDTWYKMYSDSSPDYSISCDNESFRFIDRSKGELVYFWLDAKPQSERYATFDEITKGYRTSYPWDVPFKYIPMDKVPTGDNRQGLWERRSDKALEASLAALRKSIIGRQVDSGGIWFKYLPFISEEIKGCTFWVYFVKQKGMNGQYIPVQYECRDESSGKIINGLKIEYLFHDNSLAVPLLITDINSIDHSQGEGTVTRLSDHGFDVEKFIFPIDPSESKRAIDYVTGMEIEQ